MAPKIKIIYFNFRARAEISRLILAQAGVPYEDVRLTDEEFKEKKQTFPFGQLPIMEYDGTQMVQSLAIARFLAREHGLAGKNSIEMQKADMFADSVADLFTKVDLFFEEQDKTKQAELMKKMGDETLPKFGTIMEKFLKENGGKYLVGNDLTWADLIVCEAISNIGQWLSSPWKESSPELATYVDRIFSLPKIKKWIETRPKTVS